MWILFKLFSAFQKRDLFSFGSQIITQHASAMFVFMAIDAEIFPVGAVGRIISVVTVPVMNGQKVAVLIFKLSSALGTDETVNAERPLPVIA